jgi:hypothetical protein
MLCHSRRVLSRGRPRGLTAHLYRLWSREAIRRIFRYCFHLVNSRPKRPRVLALLSNFFLSPRPSPRCVDYSRMAERVQATSHVTLTKRAYASGWKGLGQRGASAAGSGSEMLLSTKDPKGPLRDFENRYRLRWREAVRDPSCRSRCSLRQDDKRISRRDLRSFMLSCASNSHPGCRCGACARMPSSRTFRAADGATSLASRREPRE